MYKVTRATIIKDGKPVKSYEINEKTDNLDDIRKEVANRYSTECMAGIQVDLRYKEIGE